MDAQKPSNVRTLEELAEELTVLGWSTRLEQDNPYPYLRVMVNGVYREYIFAARHDEPHYTWASTSRQHPIDDPAGAARRITADLEHRRTPALRG